MSTLVNINELKKIDKSDDTYTVVLTKENKLALLDNNAIKDNIEEYFNKAEVDKLLSLFAKINGSTPLTNHWNIGNYKIRFK